MDLYKSATDGDDGLLDFLLFAAQILHHRLKHGLTRQEQDDWRGCVLTSDTLSQTYWGIHSLKHGSACVVVRNLQSVSQLEKLKVPLGIQLFLRQQQTRELWREL